MRLMFRKNKTPADSFREVVDAAMREAFNRVAPQSPPEIWHIKKMARKSKKDLGHLLCGLYYKRCIPGNVRSEDNGEFIVFESTEEIFARGKTDKPYKKTRNETTNEVVISCGGDGNYSDATIDKMLSESWSSSKGEAHNFVWQRFYLEVRTNISKSKNWSPIMKDFNDQIADEYGNAVWNGIFDKDQRFFIMLWRMNVFYSRSNPKQKWLIFSIKGFYKSMKKAIRRLRKKHKKESLKKLLEGESSDKKCESESSNKKCESESSNKKCESESSNKECESESSNKECEGESSDKGFESESLDKLLESIKSNKKHESESLDKLLESETLGELLAEVNFDNSDAYVLEVFFKILLKEIKKDKKGAYTQMVDISNYFAEDFGKMLWYGRFSELQKFIIVCSEVGIAWQFLKQ